MAGGYEKVFPFVVVVTQGSVPVVFVGGIGGGVIEVEGTAVGQAANSHEGGTRPTDDPSGQSFASIVQATSIGSDGETGFVTALQRRPTNANKATTTNKAITNLLA